MKKIPSTSRRDFLKMTAVSAAGLSLGTVGVTMSSAKAAAWTAGKQINPNIPNTRVVSCTDQKMITNLTKAKSTISFAGTTGQNSLVDKGQVEANMNAMAKVLTGKSSTQEAWSAIFMKPAAKEWSAVKAAIKVNCIYSVIMPKIAIVNKVCAELLRLGVTPANITIYDACSDASGNEKYTPFIGNGLPNGIIVSTVTGDGVSVPVGTSTLTCCSVLAQNSGSTIGYPTDILINCAVNKGHGSEHGGFTMCMKNHTGSLKLSCPSAEEIIAENQCEAIIGGSDNAPCRQQLCIIDSLWAAVDGPTSKFSHWPCAISMGTLAPVVDYQVALKIRKEVMGVAPNQEVIDSWLTSFGVSTGDLEWVAVPPSATRNSGPSNPGSARLENFRIMLDNGSFKQASVSFDLPRSVRPESIVVRNTQGNLVCRLPENSGVSALWDGKDRYQRVVPSGNYIITIKAGKLIKSATMTVIR
jgi:hypothetical protein